MIKDLCDWVREAFEEHDRSFLDEAPQDKSPEWINETEIEWRMRSYGE